MIRHFRFSVSQFMLLTVFCCVAAAALSAAWRKTSIGGYTSIAFSPDGSALLASDWGGGPRVWDLQQERPVAKRIRAGSAQRSHFVGQTTILITKYDAGTTGTNLIVWDLTSNRAVNTVKVPYYSLEVALASQAKVVATANAAGTSVDIWSLGTGVKLSTLRLPGRPSSVDLSPDGRTLSAIVFTAGATSVEIWDVPTAKRRGQLTGGSYHACRLLPDNRSAVVAGVQSATSESLLEIWDTTRIGRRSSLPQGTSYYQQFACSPQGRVLVGMELRGGLAVWDVETGQLKLSRAGDADHYLYARNFAWPCAVAVAPDEKTLAVARGDCSRGIALYDVDTGEPLRVIGGFSRVVPATMFSLAFVVWAVVWGRVSRKAVPPSRQSADVKTHTTAVRSDSRRVRPNMVIWWICFALLLPLFLLNSFTGWPGLTVWTLLGVILAGIVLLFFVILAVMIVLTLARPILDRLRNRPYASRMRRAEKVAGPPQRDLQFGPVRVLLFGTSLVEAVLPETLEAAQSERFSELFGTRVEYRRRLLIVGFDRKEHFEAYLNTKLELVGAYTGWLEKEIVVCQQATLEALSVPHQQLAGLLGYHLFHQEKGFLAPTWLSMIINAHTGYGDDGDALARAHRALQAEFKSGVQRIRPHLVGLPRRALVRIISHRDRTNDEVLASLIWRARSLAAFLTGELPAAARAELATLLRELKPTKAHTQALEQHFSGNGGLVTQWQRWMLTQEPAPHQAPPRILERQLVRHAVLVAGDASTDPRECGRSIRRLGASGYALAAEPLIEMLKSNNPDLKSDAIWGLRAITGDDLGDDVDRWQSWWNDLDMELKSPRLVESCADEVLPQRGEPEPASEVPRDTGATETPVADITNAAGDDPRKHDGSDGVANGGAVVSKSGKAPLPVPIQIKACWWLMTIGGLCAIVWSMFSLFSVLTAGQMYLPFLSLGSYYGIWMGTMVLARGSARSVTRLRGTPTLQMINLISCDVLNLALGLIERQLLRRPEAARYLDNVLSGSSST